MFNYLIGLSLLMLIEQSAGTQATKTKKVPPATPNVNGETVSPEPPHPRVFRMEDKGPDGSVTVFESLGKPPAMAFRTGYFGMPVILGPYETSDKKLNLIANGSLYRFSQKDHGFSLESLRKLPPQPPERHLEFIENAHFSEVWTKESILQAHFFLGSILGYQLDEFGNLYWIGSTRLFRQLDEGWKLIYAFPESFASRRATNYSRTGVILLPERRIALLGDDDYFIKIIELGDKVEDSKIIKAIDYDSLGCTADNYPAQAGPQFCISSGTLFFHLRKTGHIFRLNLTSLNLKEIDVPWMVQEFGKPNLPLKWKNTNGSSNITNPIVPESIAFSLEADGTVHAIALMFNNPMSAMHTFTLSGETSNIKSELQIGEDIPNPILYQNSKGDLVPISTAKIETETKPAIEPR